MKIKVKNVELTRPARAFKIIVVDNEKKRYRGVGLDELLSAALGHILSFIDTVRWN